MHSGPSAIWPATQRPSYFHPDNNGDQRIFGARLATKSPPPCQSHGAGRTGGQSPLDQPAPGLKEKLAGLKAGFEALPDFGDVVKLEAVLREGAQKAGVEAKVLIHPLRLALTGKGVSPGIFELMKALGKDVCLERLGRLLEKL